jgi:sugar (pentulose or hexulose) kinase
MMRAAFEGVAFSLRAGLDALESAGRSVGALRFAGGGSAHPWWRQLLADALRKPSIVRMLRREARHYWLVWRVGLGRMRIL